METCLSWSINKSLRLTGNLDNKMTQTILLAREQKMGKEWRGSTLNLWFLSALSSYLFSRFLAFSSKRSMMNVGSEQVSCEAFDSSGKLQRELARAPRTATRWELQMRQLCNKSFSKFNWNEMTVATNEAIPFQQQNMLAWEGWTGFSFLLGWCNSAATVN